MADKIVQLIDKDGDNIYPIASVPNGAKITMSTTDPGEGAPLDADSYVAVYGGDPIIVDYSLNEVNTGAKWIDGSPIYKKTVAFGTLPDNSLKDVPHNISNIDLAIKVEGFFFNSSNTCAPLPQNFNGNSNMYSGSVCTMRVNTTNVSIYCSTNMSGQTAYVTLYYTKTS